jgi:hypothetical protein
MLHNLQFERRWQDLRSISQFCLQKALDTIAGKVTNASRLKNGTLLMEARNDKQADVLLKAALLVSYFLHVEKHIVKVLPRSNSHIFTRWYVGRKDPVRRCWSVCLAGVQINWEDAQETILFAYHLSDIRSSFLACIPPCRLWQDSGSLMCFEPHAVLPMSEVRTHLAEVCF